MRGKHVRPIKCGVGSVQTARAKDVYIVSSSLHSIHVICLLCRLTVQWVKIMGAINCVCILYNVQVYQYNFNHAKL